MMPGARSFSWHTLQAEQDQLPAVAARMRQLQEIGLQALRELRLLIY